MTLDSQSTKPPSEIVGTRPLGFNRRYSGSLLPPKGPPDINALIAKVQLSATPQNLLDVYGVASAPDPKHSPSERLVGQPRDQAWEESENEYPDREDGHVG